MMPDFIHNTSGFNVENSKNSRLEAGCKSQGRWVSCDAVTWLFNRVIKLISLFEFGRIPQPDSHVSS